LKSAEKKQKGGRKCRGRSLDTRLPLLPSPLPCGSHNSVAVVTTHSLPRLERIPELASPLSSDSESRAGRILEVTMANGMGDTSVPYVPSPPAP